MLANLLCKADKVQSTTISVACPAPCNLTRCIAACVACMDHRIGYILVSGRFSSISLPTDELRLKSNGRSHTTVQRIRDELGCPTLSLPPIARQAGADARRFWCDAQGRASLRLSRARGHGCRAAAGCGAAGLRSPELPAPGMTSLAYTPRCKILTYGQTAMSGRVEAAAGVR